MKKLFIAALMALSATAAIAGDSDALKAILKAKNYAEAEQLVSSSVASLASNAEKAKAYNHLVDLAIKQFQDQQAILQTNQIMGKSDPVDTDAMYEGAYNALKAAVECDKYDQLPDEKGKVKPKFADPNKDRVWNARVQLVNAGQEAAQNDKADLVLKYWGTFIDTDDAQLFSTKTAEKEQEKEYFGQVAFFAARYAYQAKDFARCDKYCDLAMKDPTQAKDALNLKLFVLKEGLSSKADSLAYVDKLKALYASDNTNEVVLDNLNTMYSSMGMEKEQLELLDNALAANPNSFVALANKGIYYMSKNDVDNAIEALQKAVNVQPENVITVTYLGACKNVKAGQLQGEAGKVLYAEAVALFDKAKELDPQQMQARWAYNRYSAYYGLYGETDSRTQAAKADAGM